MTKTRIGAVLDSTKDSVVVLLDQLVSVSAFLWEPQASIIFTSVYEALGVRAVFNLHRSYFTPGFVFRSPR